MSTATHRIVRQPKVAVRADIQILWGLSAHADRTELGRWLDAVGNVRQVALHHGERGTQRGFAGWLKESAEKRGGPSG
jgi:predicted metal-dependent RNase